MILLDTCVVSEAARTEVDPRVATWLADQDDATLFLSVLTIGEIQRGVDLLQDGQRKDGLTAWLGGLSRTFADRLLPVDEAVARTWGTVTARARREGRSRPPVDALIAATALQHDLTLATRNVRDFEGTGVRLVDPWAFPGQVTPGS